jgi:hypothetical protein
MTSQRDVASLQRAIVSLIEDGSIRLDGEYIVWQSAVYALIDCVFSAQANYSGGGLAHAPAASGVSTSGLSRPG